MGISARHCDRGMSFQVLNHWHWDPGICHLAYCSRVQVPNLIRLFSGPPVRNHNTIGPRLAPGKYLCTPNAQIECLASTSSGGDSSSGLPWKRSFLTAPRRLLGRGSAASYPFLARPRRNKVEEPILEMQSQGKANLFY